MLASNVKRFAHFSVDDARQNLWCGFFIKDVFWPRLTASLAVNFWFTTGRGVQAPICGSRPREVDSIATSGPSSRIFARLATGLTTNSEGRPAMDLKGIRLQTDQSGAVQLSRRHEEQRVAQARDFDR